MAQGDGALFNKIKERVLRKEIDLNGGDTIKCALVYGYTPNIDTHLNWGDISSAQCSGTGYTSGGVALASPTATVNNTNDNAVFDAGDASWTGLQLAQTPSHAIIYDDTHANDALIGYIEVTTATNGGDYTIQWNGSGIFTLG